MFSGGIAKRCSALKGIAGALLSDDGHCRGMALCGTFRFAEVMLGSEVLGLAEAWQWSAKESTARSGWGLARSRGALLRLCSGCSANLGGVRRCEERFSRGKAWLCNDSPSEGYALRRETMLSGVEVKQRDALPG